MKAARQTDEDARDEASSAVSKAECILELVAERTRMKEYPANELPKEFLRQTLRNEVSGDYGMHYLECRNVNRALLTSQEIETIDAALETVIERSATGVRGTSGRKRTPS